MNIAGPPKPGMPPMPQQYQQPQYAAFNNNQVPPPQNMMPGANPGQTNYPTNTVNNNQFPPTNGMSNGAGQHNMMPANKVPVGQFSPTANPPPPAMAPPPTSQLPSGFPPQPIPASASLNSQPQNPQQGQRPPIPGEPANIVQQNGHKNGPEMPPAISRPQNIGAPPAPFNSQSQQPPQQMTPTQGRSPMQPMQSQFPGQPPTHPGAAPQQFPGQPPTHLGALPQQTQQFPGQPPISSPSNPGQQFPGQQAQQFPGQQSQQGSFPGIPPLPIQQSNLGPAPAQGMPPMPGQMMQQPGMFPPQPGMPMQYPPGAAPVQQPPIPGQQQFTQPGAMPPQPQQFPPGVMPSRQNFNQPPGMYPQQQQTGQFPQQPGQFPQQPGMGGQYPASPLQAAPQRRLDPDQMPNPIQVMAENQRTAGGPFSTLQVGQIPPLVTTDFITQDQGNSGPRYVRSTMYNVPATTDMMKQSAVPFALIISPFARAVEGEMAPPIVDFGDIGPIRCIRCKAYMSPHMQFTDAGRRFQCLLCKATTEGKSLA